MNNETEERKSLSLETEKAVRVFVLQLVIPPAILASILSFLVGYFVKNAAYNEAFNDALLFTTKQATSSLMDYQHHAANAVADARASSKAAIKHAGDAETKLKYLEKNLTRVEIVSEVLDDLNRGRDANVALMRSLLEEMLEKKLTDHIKVSSISIVDMQGDAQLQLTSNEKGGVIRLMNQNHNVVLEARVHGIGNGQLSLFDSEGDSASKKVELVAHRGGGKLIVNDEQGRLKIAVD